MIDQWIEELRCSSCEHVGVVSLSQGAGERTPKVLSTPDGFFVIRTEYGPGFYCATCNVAVEPNVFASDENETAYR
jgi:hypothetical protein